MNAPAPSPPLHAPETDLRLDFDRAARIGIEEAIYAAGKSVDHLVAILDQARARKRSLLLTRVRSDQWSALPSNVQAELSYDPISGAAVFGTPRAVVGEPHIALVAAGTSDAFVVNEAEWTLRYHGAPAARFMDVGVAGLWRLLERIDDIRRYPIVIVFAGMDAALPTVMGGLVGSVVIAVPTSVGYGAAGGGESALRATLASCSAGVTVMNVDNGFGAACAALRVLAAATALAAGTGPVARLE